MAVNSGKTLGEVVACVVVVSTGEDSVGVVSEGVVSVGVVSVGGDSRSEGDVSGGAASCADVPEVLALVAEVTAEVSLGALLRGGGVVETWLLLSPHEAVTKATARKPITAAEY